MQNTGNGYCGYYALQQFFLQNDDEKLGTATIHTGTFNANIRISSKQI